MMMTLRNRIIGTTIGLLMILSVGHAQSKWELGIRFIPQSTTFRYNQGIGPLYDFLKVTAPYYSRIRTAQGVGVTYNYLPHLHLGADLLYSLQGGGYEHRKTNLNYLKLPLWIGYNSSIKRKLIFTVQSGVELSYLLRAKMKYEDGQNEDIRRYVKKASGGIPIAMGVKFKVLHSYFVHTQLYLYTDWNSISKTNSVFGVYNYVYPGFRISIDQNLDNLKRK